MKITILIALAIVASRPTTAAADPCIDPTSFGAVPNDGMSDRAAIQLALDLAASQPPSTVCLGPGTWDLDRAPLTAYNKYAALATHGRYVTIRGVGPTTVLRATGDLGARALYVLSIDPSAYHVEVATLAIDTSGTTNTDEQTHAIATSGTCGGATCQPITSVSIHDVMFAHPASPDGSRKGDCVRLLGASLATQVYDVVISHNDFGDCARSAVELQRGLHGVSIVDNRINCTTCDQAIDGEASGGSSTFVENEGLEIARNVFTDGPSVQGAFDITVTGSGTPYSGVRIHDNRLQRGVGLYRTRDVEVDHEVLGYAPPTAEGLVDARNACSGLRVHDVVLTRTGGVAGPVIRLTPHSGAACGGVNVASSVLSQGTTSPVVYAESASDVTLTGSTIVRTAPGDIAAYSRATISPVVGWTVDGCAVSGPSTYGLYLSAAPYPISGTTIRSSAVAAPASCSGAGGVAPLDMVTSSMQLGTCR